MRRPETADGAERGATMWLLIAMYECRPLVPLAWVGRDFFGGMTKQQLVRRYNEGRLDLPIVRTTNSQKAEPYVALVDLADYIDRNMAQARAQVGAFMDEWNSVRERYSAAGREFPIG